MLSHALRTAALLALLIAELLSVSLMGPGARADITRFGEVAPGVFRGSRPDTDADFEFLKSKGIKTILSLQTLPWDVDPERARAALSGFQFASIPIIATPIEPNKAHVDAAVAFLDDPSHYPLYVHCRLGRDRTGLIVALFLIYDQGWSDNDAYQGWEEFGYRRKWTLEGLERYFQRHKDDQKK